MLEGSVITRFSFFFYKQPVYKQLALGYEKNKQLLVLQCSD